MTERERLFAEARRLKGQIEQRFAEAEAVHLDADPDGALTVALAYVNGLLNGDVYVAPETGMPARRDRGWKIRRTDLEAL